MANIYIISGDDDFARKNRAREIAADWCGENEPENSQLIEIIPGDQGELKLDDLHGRMLDALRTPPFLCETKIVWMRHHPDLDAFLTDSPSPAMKEIIAILQEPLPDGVKVLIDGPGVDRRRKGFKSLKSSGIEFETFNAPKSGDKNFAETRRALLLEFCRTSGKKIAPDATQFLLEAIGGDSGTFANELAKLDCFTAGADQITLADCRTIISRTTEAIFWEFTAAVVAGNRAGALSILAAMLDRRENSTELALLAGLSNEYQKMIQTKLAMKQLRITRPSPGVFENIPPDIKEQFPANPLLKLHPYRAFKICEAANRTSGADLANKLTAVRNCYRALVSGGGDSRILMENLICKLCASR